MISTMTTSENFLLSNQPRCPSSPYKSLIETSYVSPSNRRRRNSPTFFTSPDAESSTTDEEITDNEFELPPSIIQNSVTVSGGGFVATCEIPKPEIDISELLEELELQDFSGSGTADQISSKPLKIDPNVFKLDFSNLSNHDRTFSDCKPLEQFYQNKRASHHLSGGSLLTDATQDDDVTKNRYNLSGGGCVADLNRLNGDVEFKVSNFLNPISPSSPLTFDLTSSRNDVTNRISNESTNPFKNFIKDVLDVENVDEFSSTNPFKNFSSLNETQPQQKSVSQCSTRPASPVNESSVSNPFLINDSSPEPHPSPVNLTSFLFGNENVNKSPLPNPSSFIFAVPVFPIFQHITNSSTQTGDPITSERKRDREPVYQNVTNQLKKFMQRNDHSEYDLQCLKTTVKDLRNSGWYYENVSWQESVVLLKNTEPGTFLIRDSSDPNFLFSLSVQTSRGPTSVRLHYVDGQFRLDAEEKLIPHMPSFNSVIELIDYYIESTVKNKFASKFKKSTKKNHRNKLQKSKEQVWIDSQGNIYSNILLVKPLYKKEHFSTLQHLSRLAINKNIKKGMNSKNQMDFRVTPVYESSPFQDSSFPNDFDNFCPILRIDTLPLPVTLLEYLKDYPYCH